MRWFSATPECPGSLEQGARGGGVDGAAQQRNRACEHGIAPRDDIRGGRQREPSGRTPWFSRLRPSLMIRSAVVMLA